MYRRSLLAVAVTCYLLAAATIAAPAPKDDKGRRTAAHLQGKWEGDVVPEPGVKETSDISKAILTFKKDTFALTYLLKEGDAFITYKGVFTLDFSKEQQGITMEITEVVTVFEELVNTTKVSGKKLRGIYEVNKSSLKWCTSEVNGVTRPKTFATRGDEQFLYKFEKAKP